MKRIEFVATEPLKYGANESAEIIDPDLPRFIRITDINSDGSLRGDTFRSLPKDLAEPFILKAGDLLFARSGATVGKTFMYRESWGSACHAGYLVRLRTDLNQAIPEFLSYYANSSEYWIWLSSVFVQATIQNVSAEKYSNLLVTMPLRDEQRTIVAFLDRETAKIDTLIAKKEQLIDLLQEKRDVLINRAVTKGLDPTVPMNELPLKRWVAVKITDGPHETPEFVDVGVPFVSAEAIQNSRIDFHAARGFITDETHRRFCQKAKAVRGDILFCKAGATTGKLAVVDIDFEFSVWSPLAIIRPHPGKILSRFLFYAMHALQFQDQVRQRWSMGTQPNIGMDVIEKLRLAAPDLQLQSVIVEVLDRETAKIDALIAKAREAMEKLCEYRTALISAAVSGKIDVRKEIGHPPATGHPHRDAPTRIAPA